MKYQTLFDALTKYGAFVIDLTSGRIALNGYAVPVRHEVFGLPVTQAQEDGEAFDTTIDRVVNLSRVFNSDHLIVRIEDGDVTVRPAMRALNKEFTLGYAVAFSAPFIWNVNKNKPIPITDRLVGGFWIKEPDAIIAEGAKQ